MDAIIPPRGFLTGPPVIRLADGTTVKRTCRFDEFANQPEVTRFDYEEVDLAPVTPTESGREVRHPARVRFVFEMNFEIRHPNYRGPAARDQMFTEADYRWLKLAQTKGWTVEVFPSDQIPEGTAPHPVFQANVFLTTSRVPEEDGRILWRVALTARGVNAVRDEMPEMHAIGKDVHLGWWMRQRGLRILLDPATRCNHWVEVKPGCIVVNREILT
jgi:hypothetical protein